MPPFLYSLTISLAQLLILFSVPCQVVSRHMLQLDSSGNPSTELGPPGFVTPSSDEPTFPVFQQPLFPPNFLPVLPFPSMPTIPTMPIGSTLPGFAGLPSLPTVPLPPGLPVFPSLPGVPLPPDTSSTSSLGRLQQTKRIP